MKKLLIYLLFLTALSTTLLACSKTEDSYTIAIVQPVDHPSLNTIRESIIEGLKEEGLEEEIKIIVKNANNNPSLLPSIMSSLKSDNVDIIVPIATNTAQAALSASSSTPIVFAAVSNPVEAGLVSSLEETNNTITGVSDAIATEDILKLALKLSPTIKTFGFVYNSSEINSVTGIAAAKAFCEANGIAYKEALVNTTGDLLQAATSLIGDIDAFYTPIDNTVASAMTTYSSIAEKANIPIYVSADSMVKDGGLATIGIDYNLLGKQTASMVAKIYHGEDITNIPIETLTEYTHMLNKKVADNLGIQLTEEELLNFTIIE